MNRRFNLLRQNKHIHTLFPLTIFHNGADTRLVQQLSIMWSLFTSLKVLVEKYKIKHKKLILSCMEWCRLKELTPVVFLIYWFAVLKCRYALNVNKAKSKSTESPEDARVTWLTCTGCSLWRKTNLVKSNKRRIEAKTFRWKYKNKSAAKPDRKERRR